MKPNSAYSGSYSYIKRPGTQIYLHPGSQGTSIYQLESGATPANQWMIYPFNVDETEFVICAVGTGEDDCFGKVLYADGETGVSGDGLRYMAVTLHAYEAAAESSRIRWRIEDYEGGKRIVSVYNDLWLHAGSDESSAYLLEGGGDTFVWYVSKGETYAIPSIGTAGEMVKPVIEDGEIESSKEVLAATTFLPFFAVLDTGKDQYWKYKHPLYKMERWSYYDDIGSVSNSADEEQSTQQSFVATQGFAEEQATSFEKTTGISVGIETEVGTEFAKTKLSVTSSLELSYSRSDAFSTMYEESKQLDVPITAGPGTIVAAWFKTDVFRMYRASSGDPYISWTVGDVFDGNIYFDSAECA